jgi:hypothetical protein
MLSSAGRSVLQPSALAGQSPRCKPLDHSCDTAPMFFAVISLFYFRKIQFHDTTDRDPLHWLCDGNGFFVVAMLIIRSFEIFTSLWNLIPFGLISLSTWLAGLFSDQAFI